MKVQSKLKPKQIDVKKEGNMAQIILVNNIEQTEREVEDGETEGFYQFDKVDFELPHRKNLEQSINNNFETYFEFGKEKMKERQEREKSRRDTLSLTQNYNLPRVLHNVKPIELVVDKQEITANGNDTATITGEVPERLEKAYVLVNAPPPIYEVVNDGNIEIEFTTEDEGYHVIEVTAGNHRGLIVIKGVNTSG